MRRRDKEKQRCDRRHSATMKKVPITVKYNTKK